MEVMGQLPSWAVGKKNKKLMSFKMELDPFSKGLQRVVGQLLSNLGDPSS